MNEVQKGKLNQALKDFIDRCPEFKAMYDKLVGLEIKINFAIDPSVFEKNGGNAGYTEKKLFFREEACITVDNLQEEMIHAIQELEIYGVTTMKNSRKNMEFEAKVMQDVLNYRHEMGRVNMGSMGQSTPFMNNYAQWMLDASVNQALLINRFHEFCVPWTGYGGNYTPTLQPKLLINYSNY